MTKTFSFKTNNSGNKFFLNNTTTASEALDNIITSSIIKKNNYLFNHTDDSEIDLFDYPKKNKKTYIPIHFSSILKDDEFINAAKFLANYKIYKKSIKIPYIIGKMYELIDGTPIIFYDDEIQIGFDTYSYADFNNIAFLNTLSTNTKKVIINIYTANAANIKINIL